MSGHTPWRFIRRKRVTEPVADLCIPREDSSFAAVMAVASQQSLFAHWTDADLYRAIDLPENGEPGEAQEREIAQYVEELRKRSTLRELQAQREAELREKYRL